MSGSGWFRRKSTLLTTGETSTAKRIWQRTAASGAPRPSRKRGAALTASSAVLVLGAGVTIVARRPFPDHHPYTAPEIQDILETAKRLDAIAVTTPKDAVRLPLVLRARVRVVGVRLVWDDEAVIETLLPNA